jgi:hypothetical protein
MLRCLVGHGLRLDAAQKPQSSSSAAVYTSSAKASHRTTTIEIKGVLTSGSVGVS